MNTKTEHINVENELIAITKQLLSESAEYYAREVKLSSSLQRHLGIDSLARAELFKRIEKNFKVTLPDKLLAEAENLQDVKTYLQNAKIQFEENIYQGTFKSKAPTYVSPNPNTCHTLIDVLTLYAEKTPEKPHIYFMNEQSKEEVITYSDLMIKAQQVAQSLRGLGLKEGETVAIMQPTHPNFFYTFFGTLFAGGIPVPIYPPFRMHMLEEYAKLESRILKNAEARILVTFTEAKKLSQMLQAFIPSLKHVVTVKDLLQEEKLTAIYPAKTDSFAFIQYTSGSTSDPKGVLLKHKSLLANIRAYGKAIKVTPDDVAVSWLPLYHDMGLIGMWLGSLYHGIPLVLMTPFSFLNHPEKWLWALHYHRGTVTGAPNFAYELCVRKIEPALLEGLDLSSCRVMANGAEKVYPRTLQQFVQKFEKYGLKPSAVMPVYGLAETTVCLTVPPLERQFKVDYVDRKKFEKSREAEPVNDKNALAFVSCGLPIPGHEIRIMDENNQLLGERRVGILQFKGPSSMQGYYNNPRATEAIYHNGWFSTGDLAYIADGEMYITGRLKDLIIKAGRNLYPAEIEEIVGNVPGVRLGCVAAFGFIDPERGTEQLIVVAETREKDKSQQKIIMQQIQEKVSTSLDIVPDHIILVAPHTVPKTSSGKLQRATCKKMFLEGDLGKIKPPTWLQLMRLGSNWLKERFLTSSKFIAKFIYSFYVGLVFLISFFPIYLIVLIADRELAAKTCKFWAKLLQVASFMPFDVTGVENLIKKTPVIFASNHTSYLDSLIMLLILPAHTRFIGKKEILNTPILKTFMKKLDYLPVERIELSKGLADAKSIEDALRNGHSILIFPEGTFSYSSGLRPFRLGAFKLAVETGVPICPIALKGTRKILRGDEYLLSPNPVSITICEPIAPKGIDWKDVILLRSEVRSKIAQFCGEASLDFIAAEKIAPN